MLSFGDASLVSIQYCWQLDGRVEYYVIECSKPHVWIVHFADCADAVTAVLLTSFMRPALCGLFSFLALAASPYD
jgi:hypothetical protein